MISLSPEANRALFEAIHAVVGMACAENLYAPDCGICKNVQSWFRDFHPEFEHLTYKTLSEIFDDMGLPKTYPIPYDGNLLWRGKYLKLRMDLCSKLMSYLDINLVHTIFSEQHDELLPALKALAFLPSSAMPWPRMGVCANVEALMTESSSDFVYSELEYIFAEMGFPDPRQPIEYGFDDKWEGSAGIARRKLLAGLIKHLEGLENVPA